MKVELEKIRIACSPITKTIFAGSIVKEGMWRNKVDVTDQVYAAVIEANLNQVHNMSFGDRTFELTVIEIEWNPTTQPTTLPKRIW